MNTESTTKKRDHQDIGLFVANNVDAMLAYWDKDQICRFANDGYKKWFGVGHEDMIGKITLSGLLGPLYEKNLIYIQGALSGIPQKFEREIKTPSGEIRHAIANYYPDIIEGNLQGFFVHVADVTDIKRLERELAQTNEIAKIGSWELDLRTGKVTWSHVTRAIHEVPDDYEPDKTTGFHFFKCKSRELLSHAVEKAIQSGIYYDLELLLVTAKGNEKWTRAIGQAEFENGECIRLYGTFQDIDIQKRTQDELKISAEKFSGAFEYSAIGMALVSLEGRWLKVNKKLCQILGYQEYELLSTTFADITHPDDLDLDMDNVRSMLAGTIDTYSMEKRYFHKSGNLVWVLLSVSMVKDTEGQPVHFVSQIKDITESKMAEADLRKVNRELTAIFDSGTQVSIISTNMDGIITHFSKGAETLLGYTTGEIIGKHTPAIIHKEDEVIQRGVELSKEFGREVRGFSTFVEYASQGKYDAREWTYVRKNGTTFPVQLVITAIKDDTGAITGYLGIATDLTERKQAEENARKYHDLEVKNREMEQFTYVASHDLREPLVTVASCAEILWDKYYKELDEEGQTLLEYMIQSTNRMNALIKGLLDYSRIGIERHLEAVDCSEIISEVMSDLRTRIQDTSAILEIGSMPVLNGYKTELRILFQNLISNALKFRQTGITPVIKISAIQTEDKWLFRVEDNGIGLPEKDRDKIFVIFKRLHNRSDIEGNGIGLAHCKKIVEMHNGNIWVETPSGPGSAFCFTLG